MTLKSGFVPPTLTLRIKFIRTIILITVELIKATKGPVTAIDWPFYISYTVL